MAEHFHHMKTVVTKSTDKLVEFLHQVHHKDTIITDLRRIPIKFQDNTTLTVTRCYIHTADSGLLENVGWVINDNIAFCLVCKKDFGMARWKHHCRACGNLVCSSCSKYSICIISKEDLGKVKVCKSCFKADVSNNNQYFLAANSMFTHAVHVVIS